MVNVAALAIVAKVRCMDFSGRKDPGRMREDEAVDTVHRQLAGIRYAEETISVAVRRALPFEALGPIVLGGLGRLAELSEAHDIAVGELKCSHVRIH